jgi:hypothetical protein
MINSKIVLSVLILPFLTISFTTTAMNTNIDTKRLVAVQFNLITQRPFEHDKHQLRAPIKRRLVNKNGTYIHSIIQNTNNTEPNVIEIAKQQILTEKNTVTEILKQHTPDNENEWRDAQKQIAKFNKRTEKIKKSAEILQEKLNQAFSTKRLSFVKNAADEIMKRPFNHTDHPAIIVQLTDEPKIGYMDAFGIEDLKPTALSAEQSDPFVTIAHEIAPNILDIACQQASAEQKELQAILDKLNMNNKTEEEEKRDQLARFSRRLHGMQTSVHNIRNSNLPPFIPIKHLEDGNTIHIIKDTPIRLEFKEGKKLNTLMATFKQQPTSLFCHLTPESAEKLRTIDTNELEADDITALFAEVDVIKNEFRNREIVERIPHGEIREDQNYLFDHILTSNIVEHYCNYHKHGNNGYSEKERRDEVLTSLNDNVFTFLKDRESGRRKKRNFNLDSDEDEKD